MLVSISMILLAQQASSLTFGSLYCNYMVNPVGITTQIPQFTWTIEASDHRNVTQTSYRLQIGYSNTSDGFGDTASLHWDSDVINSNRSLNVAVDAFPPSPKLYFWRVQVNTTVGNLGWSSIQSFSFGMLHNDFWENPSSFIGMTSDYKALHPKTYPQLIHDFNISSKRWQAIQTGRARAIAHVASVGFHELSINSRKAGKELLAPSSVNLFKRVRSLAYDVTDKLHQTNNHIQLWLASGWADFRDNNPSVDWSVIPHPVVKMELHLVPLSNMSRSIIVNTTSQWQFRPSFMSHVGQYQALDYGGDMINVTAMHLAKQGIHPAPQPVQLYTIDRTLSAECLEGNRAVARHHAVAVDSKRDSEQVVTMSSIFTGWSSVSGLQGPPHGMVNISYSAHANVSMEFNQLDKVLLDENGTGSFFNKFTYHEIHYVTITGLTQALTLDQVSGISLANDRPVRGHFNSSNPMYNKVYGNTLTNYIGLSTAGMSVDCPHRERLGYGGDAHTSLEFALATFPSGAFLSKVAEDWTDSSNYTAQDGDLSHTAPTLSGGGGPSWGGYAIVLPYHFHAVYNDVDLLRRMWPTITQFLAFLQSKMHAGLLQPFGGKWDFLGDWLTPHGSETSDTIDAVLFNNVYLIYILQLAAEIGEVIHEVEQSNAYRALADDLKIAVHARFYNTSTGGYLYGFQTQLALPLLADMVPANITANVVDLLIQQIVSVKTCHLDTGLHGTYFLTKLLIALERQDVLGSVINVDTYPGYGWFVQQGLTTWPENWQAQGSLLHGCYNGIGLWFNQGLGGVQASFAHPGYSYFTVSPPMYLSASHATWIESTTYAQQGDIVSNWSRNGPVFTHVLHVPANTRCKVVWNQHVTNVTEAGIPLHEVDGVGVIVMNQHQTVVDVASGAYAFKMNTIQLSASRAL
eukprot:TRINITY_DN12335_c0_g9_i2.p1 TRINITY_DN12335_c0_g9~~TRINITY_DN12335_c0_g9_i2.p1  ORF type:complete len:914 (+),score=183.96 TRINITY_DN12335_c0_g9_i2:119-2860(+)